MSYVSRTWKPVSVKQSVASYGGGAAKSTTSNSWYSNLVANESRWKERMQRYRSMDATIDINRALDIIAEDIASDNADDQAVFELLYEDAEKATSTTIKTADKTLKIWEKKVEFDYKFFQYVREMLKYGIVMFEVKPDGSLIHLRPDRIRGYILNEKDDTEVEYYLYDRNGTYKSETGEEIFTASRRETEDVEKLPVKKLFILKNGDDPLGESILEKVYRIWKQLILLEDAVVIYRIVRAPERRAFYVDIGKMPAHKAEAYVEKVKTRMSQRQIMNRGNGQLETEFDAHSATEDFFLAQSGEGRGSRIETLPGGENLGRIEDLQYFNKKLATGLRIPISYMDTYGESTDGSIHNDGRVGTAYIAELRYAGYIQRLQKRIAKSIFTNFRKFAKKFGTELPEDLEFMIVPPQSFAVYKQNELASVLLNTFASAEGSDIFSKRDSLKRYLQWDEDDILENENARLEEMGIPEKNLKKLPTEIRTNLVYGDGEVGREWIENNNIMDGEVTPVNASPDDGDAGMAQQEIDGGEAGAPPVAPADDTSTEETTTSTKTVTTSEDK